MKPKKIDTVLKEKILSNYFEINGKVATLKLVYDTFEELVNPNFGESDTKKLNDKLFSDIKEAIEILPRKYHLNVQIVIKDFGAYSEEECEKIISQNILLSAYIALKTVGAHRRGGLVLMGIGAAVLILSYFLHSSDYDIIFDIVNISGTLFVWEGAYTAFLQKNSELRNMRKLAKTLQNITVLKENSTSDYRSVCGV